jgi:hypothetical protein
LKIGQSAGVVQGAWQKLPRRIVPPNAPYSQYGVMEGQSQSAWHCTGFATASNKLDGAVLQLTGVGQAYRHTPEVGQSSGPSQNFMVKPGLFCEQPPIEQNPLKRVQQSWVGP